MEVVRGHALIGWLWNGTHEELHSISTHTGVSTLLDTIPDLTTLSSGVSTINSTMNELYLIGNGRQLFILNSLTGALVDTFRLDHSFSGIESIDTLGTLAIAAGAADRPTRYRLLAAYPNPVNPATTIQFELTKSTDVTLVVYDILGREVARLVDGDWPVGYHHLVWDGRLTTGQAARSGIYIARLVTPEYTKSIKMLLLK